MPLITWDDSYSVNVGEIDEQHKKFFGVINELHNCLVSAGSEEYFSITEKTLKALRDYTRYHFSAEEEYMREISYPDLTVHKRKHDKFYVEIKKLHSDMQSGKIVLNTELMKTLANWLQEHILNEDMQYSRFASSEGL